MASYKFISDVVNDIAAFFNFNNEDDVQIRPDDEVGVVFTAKTYGDVDVMELADMCKRHGLRANIVAVQGMLIMVRFTPCGEPEQPANPDPFTRDGLMEMLSKCNGFADVLKLERKLIDAIFTPEKG